jgi:hypothetical protein
LVVDRLGRLFAFRRAFADRAVSAAGAGANGAIGPESGSGVDDAKVVVKCCSPVTPDQS